MTATNLFFHEMQKLLVLRSSLKFAKLQSNRITKTWFPLFTLSIKGRKIANVNITNDQLIEICLGTTRSHV